MALSRVRVSVMESREVRVRRTRWKLRAQLRSACQPRRRSLLLLSARSRRQRHACCLSVDSARAMPPHAAGLPLNNSPPPAMPARWAQIFFAPGFYGAKA